LTKLDPKVREALVALCKAKTRVAGAVAILSAAMGCSDATSRRYLRTLYLLGLVGKDDGDDHPPSEFFPTERGKVAATATGQWVVLKDYNGPLSRRGAALAALWAGAIPFDKLRIARKLESNGLDWRWTVAGSTHTESMDTRLR